MPFYTHFTRWGCGLAWALQLHCNALRLRALLQPDAWCYRSWSLTALQHTPQPDAWCYRSWSLTAL
jgi:hypothetical protein